MAEEMTLEQRQALALASARLRAQQQQQQPTPDSVPGPRRAWSDVPGEALANLPSSAAKFAGGLYEAVTSPVQTAKGLLDIGAGALQNITPQVVKDFVNRFETNPEAAQRAVATANAVGGEYAKRYGSIEGFKEALATDPVGVASDFSTLLTGGAAATGKVAPTVSKALGTAATYTNPAAPIAKVAEMGLGLAARGAGGVVDLMQGQRPQVRAGSIVRNALTEEGRTPQNLLAAQQALQNMPASATVRQGLADVMSPQVQYLGELVEARAPGRRKTIQEAQEAGRQSKLLAETPDLAAAEATRKAVTAPMYEAADKVLSKVDAEFTKLQSRPSMDKVMARARNLAEERNLPFEIGKTTPETRTPSALVDEFGRPLGETVTPAQFAKLPGTSIHFIKQAFDDLIRDPATFGIGKSEAAAIAGTRGEFLKWADQTTKNPAYNKARAMFAEMSEPVNQAQVLGAMQKVLESTTGVGERVTPFMTAMGRGEQALLKKATGEARYAELSDVLTPAQMKVVGEVKSELMRDARVADQTKAGAQAMQLIMEANKSKFRLPDFMSVKVTLANQFLKLMEGKLNADTMAALEKGFQSGTDFAELMRKVPANERIEVLRGLGQVQGQLSRTKLNALAQTQNALAPEQQNQNALAK